MTDYRFVSAPEVVLRNDSPGLYYGGRYFDYELKSKLIEDGIIEPVPVEIPEHVIYAACQAYDSGDGQRSRFERIRAALIAAKRAEEAGE